MIKQAKNAHVRAWRGILVNAQSQRHVKEQSGYFGYLRDFHFSYVGQHFKALRATRVTFP